ncbi:hypothetical protein VNI00_017733 [Paramarasmius palmivorus]|uniref:Nephrocystin 3-like N-terminal domain-containing protein n=1 Tax=Paramarasmius palmivorus TaxID=297713 RepID=A0AAW0B3I7_9AGAR
MNDTALLLQKLGDHAASNATRYAGARYPPPKCNPNTRIAPLEKLGGWIQNQSRGVRMFWVNGYVGVGKSAIAQTLSEDFGEHVVASFFFSRNDSTRDRLDRVVATIAYECCTSGNLRLKNTVGPLIIDVIRSHPNIFQSSPEYQFQKLLLEPFSKLTEDQRQELADLIIVDGLDECLKPTSQTTLLKIINHAIGGITTPNPFPFRFLLCSRPEHHIQKEIKARFAASCLEELQISGATIRFAGYLTEADLDIRRYLLDEFDRLQTKYDYAFDRGETWPGEDVVMDLVERASGQFIFAVTVINYIDTDGELPQDQLQSILSTVPASYQDSRYSALDVLYQQILSTCRQWDQIRSILRILLTPDRQVEGLNVRWRSPSNIARALHLPRKRVDALLLRLHSVIRVPEPQVTGSEIQIAHASFTEFLLDPARSGKYHAPKLSETEQYDHMSAVFSSMAKELSEGLD